MCTIPCMYAQTCICTYVCVPKYMYIRTLHTQGLKSTVVLPLSVEWTSKCFHKISQLKFNKTANLSHCNYSMSTVNLPNNSKHNQTMCTGECIHINCTHLDRSVDTDSGVEGGGVSSSSPTVVATTSGLLTTHKQE